MRGRVPIYTAGCEAMNIEHDIKFMSHAMSLARCAEDQGEVPVGAVLVLDSQIIGEGANSPIRLSDVSAHAEIIALRQAGKLLNNYRLPKSTLYVTLEPCAMCAGAIIHARVDRVVIATAEPRAGAAGSVFNVLENDRLNHKCRVEYGVMKAESEAMLKAFFKTRRVQAKKAKQQTRSSNL